MQSKTDQYLWKDLLIFRIIEMNSTAIFNSYLVVENQHNEETNAIMIWCLIISAIQKRFPSLVTGHVSIVHLWFYSCHCCRVKPFIESSWQKKLNFSLIIWQSAHLNNINAVLSTLLHSMPYSYLAMDVGKVMWEWQYLIFILRESMRWWLQALYWPALLWNYWSP